MVAILEPRRDADPAHLLPAFRKKLDLVLGRMKSRGFDPIIFEGRRSVQRQEWLYSIGRTRQRSRKPVTWTLKSLHLGGNAADVISRSRGWSWPEFYRALEQEAEKAGLHTIPQEQCHLQGA